MGDFFRDLPAGLLAGFFGIEDVEYNLNYNHFTSHVK
jgi:hypothetical protein